MKQRIIFAMCLFGLLPVMAAAQQTTIGSTFQQVSQAANAWIPAIFAAATNLFLLLAALDFAWGAPSFFRENDFMGLFLSLIKKLMVVSFFYAVLINGQTWIPAIVNSFVQIGSNVTGLPLALNPSNIMASGLQICASLLDVVDGADVLTDPGGALLTLFMVVIVFASYIIITLHYVVTKLEAIIVMTAGYLFLGFGGSKWTMPFFERYIALAISTGTRLMLIYLMLGSFQTLSAQWVTTMNDYDPSVPASTVFPTLASMLLFVLASWFIPKMASSIASGSLGLGASDLLGVGAAAVTGAAVGGTTIAALAAAPFTAGGSLAAEAAAVGTEGAALAAEGTAAAGEAAAASTGVAMGAADAMAGGAGIPAPVPPPPQTGPSPEGTSPAPDPEKPDAPSGGGSPKGGASNGLAQTGDGSQESEDSPVSTDANNGFQNQRPGRRRRPGVPDDGSEHTPPPQMRIDHEE